MLWVYVLVLSMLHGVLVCRPSFRILYGAKCVECYAVVSLMPMSFVIFRDLRAFVFGALNCYRAFICPQLWIHSLHTNQVHRALIPTLMMRHLCCQPSICSNMKEQILVHVYEFYMHRTQGRIVSIDIFQCFIVSCVVVTVFVIVFHNFAKICCQAAHKQCYGM